MAELTNAQVTKLTGLPSDAPPTSRSVIAGAGLTGGGTLAADRTFDVGANADGSIVVNANDVQVGVLATDGQHGNRGGGGIHALVVAAGAAGFMSGSDKTKLDGLPSSAVPTSRTITAGAGLTGGGDLTTDRTLDVVAHADGSIVVNANDVQVGVLATDAQHGNRGGGALHAAATTGTAGFMSAADKTKLDGLPGILKTIQSSTGNVGAGEDDLHTFSVPGGTLASDGESIEAEFVITFANNANAKRTRVYFGATALYDSTSIVTTDGSQVIRVRIVRTGAATQRANAAVTTTAAATTLPVAQHSYTTPAETLSGAVTLRVTAEATANDDVVATMTVVKKIGAAN